MEAAPPFQPPASGREHLGLAPAHPPWRGHRDRRSRAEHPAQPRRAHLGGQASRTRAAAERRLGEVGEERPEVPVTRRQPYGQHPHGAHACAPGPRDLLGSR
ncbi:hypothetical protein [Nonomuraea recticatena]|uniref:hypothetical protein n=1 Tax=Nonomuraea recticatena TaxID=46178 RepID=UPI0036072755